MSTTNSHPDYIKLLPRYQTIRDCINDDVVSGSYSSSTYCDTSREYLIRTPGMKDSTFNALKQLGVFMNITGSTLISVMGVANRMPPVIVMPDAVSYLEINADGRGNKLKDIIKDAMSDTTSMGRFGVLVEPPSQRLDDEGNVIETSKADVSSGKVRTNLKTYAPESITDYQESVINDVKALSLVKLMECITVRNENTFQSETEVRYRFLILNDDGYHQQVFNDSDGTDPVADMVMITGFDGKALDHIPFYFSGSKNNDADADNPPYYKLADKNVALYNLDANNRLNLNLHATGTLILTGDAEDLGKKDLTIGGGNGIYLGPTGSATLLQLEAGKALPEAIETEKKDMVELGAKLSSPDVQRTLGEAEMSMAQELALLSSVTDNVEDMLKLAIADLILIQTGKEADFELVLNRNFFPKGVTAQQLVALKDLWQAGAISKAVFDAALIQNEVIDVDTDLDKMNSDIESESDMVDLDAVPVIAAAE
jgi:hypothetical protein